MDRKNPPGLERACVALWMAEDAIEELIEHLEQDADADPGLLYDARGLLWNVAAAANTLDGYALPFRESVQRLRELIHRGQYAAVDGQVVEVLDALASEEDVTPSLTPHPN